MNRLWPLAARVPLAFVVSVLGVRLFDEWMSFLPSGAFEAFRSDLDLSYGAASVILTLMAVGGIAGSAFSVLADSRSRRVIASIGAFGYSAATLAFGLGESPVVLGLASMGIGLFATAMVDGIDVATVDAAGDHLELVLARVNVGATIGDLLAPGVLAVILALGYSWRAAFVVSAFAMFAFACVVAATPFAAPLPEHADDHAPVRDTLAMLRHPLVWWAGLLGAGLVALDESFDAYVIAQFDVERGVSTTGSVAVGSMTVVGGAVASIWLARRTPSTPTAIRLRVAAFVMTIAAVLVAVVPTVGLAAIAAGATGAGVIMFWLPFQAITLRLIPGRAGTVKAVVGAIEMFGLLIPIGIGVLADRVGLRQAMLAYALVPAAMLIFCVVAPYRPLVNARADEPA